MAPTREGSTTSVTFLAPLVAFVGLVGAGCNACAYVGAPWDAGPPAEKVAAGLAADLALGPGNDALAAITTPNESAEKIPWFAAGPSYAPSLGYDEANALFDGATAEVPLPAAGMLACRLTTAKSSLSGPLGVIGIGSAPTISLSLEVGRRRYVFGGAGGAYTSYATIPLVALDRATVLEAQFEPRTGDTTVRLSTTARGGLQGDGVTCDLVSRERLEPIFRRVLQEVTAKLGTAAIAAHAPTNDDEAHALDPIATSVATETSRLAAYVGWADPRVVERVLWGERIVLHHVFRSATPEAQPSVLKGAGLVVSAQTSAPCTREALTEAFAEAPRDRRPATGCAFRVKLTRRHDVTEQSLDADPSAGAPRRLQAFVVLENGTVLQSTGTSLTGRVHKTPFGGPMAVNLPADEDGFLYAYFDALPVDAKPRAIVLRREAWTAIAYREIAKPKAK